MKRYVMAGLGIMFLCVVSAVHAEMEVKVKDNTTNNGFSIKEETTGSTIARFRGDGRVGIGTTAPFCKFHVAGDSRITGNLVMANQSASPNDEAYIAFRNAVSEGLYVGIEAESPNRLASGSIPNAGVVVAAEGDPLQLGGNQTVHMTITSGGNVGIGTTTPQYKLHVNGNVGVGNYGSPNRITVLTNNIGYFVGIKNPTSPTTKAESFLSQFQKDVLQVGDANQIRLGFFANNDVGGTPDTRFFTAIEAIVEDPNHSTRKAGLRFMTTPSGPWETERMRITGDGNVGIGYTSPSYKLDVNGTIRGSNVSPSDVRWKEQVKTLDHSLEKVNKLRGVSFEWKDKAKGTGKQIGLIAQEVEKVFPEVVSADNEGYKSVAYDKLVGVLVESIKELKAQKDTEIAALKAEIEALKASFSNNVRVVAQ